MGEKLAAPADITIETGARPQDPAAAAADNASLKKRMRISTEAIVKMVSPVFLAVCVSVAKVDMRDKPGVRVSLSILVGFTLGSGIAGLLPLSFPNRFPHKRIPFVFSMACIHLCGISLMVLAYIILLLISKGDVFWLVIPLVGIAILTLIWCFLATRNGHQHGQTAVLEKFLDKLENSVDLSAAIIFLLFLGFGLLLLEGQYSTIVSHSHAEDNGMLRLLASSIWLSFFICIADVLFMLVCMAPRMTNGGSEGIFNIIEGFNYFFGGALALIVLLITLGKLKHWWVATLALVLSTLPFICGALILPCFGGAIERGDEKVKPASLDLTKVTFAGFLAISVYTISEDSPVSFRDSSCWFIFFTAIAVNNGLGWRLITHHKKPSAAWFTAGNFASLCAHIYITAAVIPFALMASKGFTKIVSAPSPSGI